MFMNQPNKKVLFSIEHHQNKGDFKIIFKGFAI